MCSEVGVNVYMHIICVAMYVVCVCVAMYVYVHNYVLNDYHVYMTTCI